MIQRIAFFTLLLWSIACFAAGTPRAGSSTSFNATSGTLAAPAGLTAGDFQLAVVAVDNGSATISAPTGTGAATWTQVGTTQFITGNGQSVALFQQVAGPTEPSTYTFVSNKAARTGVAIMAWSGISGVDGANWSVNLVNAGTPPTTPVTMNATTITPSVGNQTAVYIAQIDWNGGGTPTFTVPTGYALEEQYVGNVAVPILIADITQTGATGTVSGVATNSTGTKTGNYVAWEVALLDSGGGSAAPTNGGFAITAKVLPCRQKIACAKKPVQVLLRRAA